jgi:hypothetical protein
MNGNVINNKRANRLFLLYTLFMNLPLYCAYDCDDSFGCVYVATLSRKMYRDRFISGPIWPARIDGIDLSFGFNCGLASSKDAAAMSARLRWQSIGTNWIAAVFRRHGLGCCPESKRGENAS